MANGETRICTVCGQEISPQDNLVLCNGCGKPYHAHCWAQYGRCQTQGCEGTPVYQPVGEAAAPPPYQYQAGPAAPAASGTVQNHLVWAILATLFCCLPFGVVAIIYSSQVSGHISAGNYDAAVQSSNKARGWCLAATITGAVVILISVLAGIIPVILSLISYTGDFL